MSLFRVKEFWHTRCGCDERYDHNSLRLTRLNGDYDYVLTGSHSGILRIFKPSTEYNDDGLLTGFNVNDCILEQEFPTPILQIESGRLVSGSKSTQIVVLHPRSACVYSLTQKEGVAEHGAQNSLTLTYEHKLKRSAANIVVGAFGGSINRDFICVQSLDGMLTFYEQECFAFCCFLPNFLIPGPLIYNKRTDSFVTFSSNWSIESYIYKRLSETGQNSNLDENSGQKATSNWTYRIGEEILDVKCVLNHFNNKESFIVVLSDRNVYCLNDNGSLNFMKKLEYPPSCFNCYVIDDKLMLMIVSDTRSVLIYERTTLKWSAVLSTLPVCIERIFLKAIRGGICLLTEDGSLELCYLGTEPNLFTAPPIINKSLDFEKAEEELRTLTKMLKRSQTNDVKLSNSNTEREMIITIKVNPHIDVEDLFISNRFVSLRTCTIIIDVLPQALFEEIHLSVIVRKPLNVTPESNFFKNLSKRTEVICKVYLENDFDVPSLELEVIVSFISNLSVPRVINKIASLPLTLFMDTCSAIKENEYKMILNINKNLVPLSTLFPEFAGENSLGINSNVVGFKRIKDDSSNPITILTAKSSQRYRLQCDSITSMVILIEEMIRRLKEYYKDVNEFEITLGTQLPTNKIFDYVKDHFDTRKRVVQLEQELSQISSQFRLIQKRLISKFKNKNPTSLSNLVMLLNDTNEDIMRICDKICDERKNLNKIQIELCCCLNLISITLRLMDVNVNLDAFESIFLPYVYDLETQNWEDIIDAGLCYVLRTILAKSDKDRLRAAHTSFDEVKDMNKFEKHFVTVIERLAKKGPLIDVNIVNDEELPEVIKQDVNDESNKTNLLPIGSQFGESSSRALSARRSLLQRRNKVIEDN